MENRKFKIVALAVSFLIVICCRESLGIYARGSRCDTCLPQSALSRSARSLTHSGLQDRQDAKTMIEQGRRVYSGSCSMSYCHANDGVGGGGPRLRDREFSAQYLTKVISDGVPGTSMPAFKNSLRKEQVAQLVAYLLSINVELKRIQGPEQIDQHLAQPTGKSEVPSTSSKPVEVMNSPVKIADPAGIFGDAAGGESLFFDSSQIQTCRVCHPVRGRGGKVASDLSRLGDRAPREIFMRILSTQGSPDGKYQNLAITLKTGEQYSGIKRDEDRTSLRLYDTSTLPPVSPNCLKSEITRTEKLSGSGCPGNYASKFTLKQLLDLVAFFKTIDPAKPVTVSLQDMF